MKRLAAFLICVLMMFSGCDSYRAFLSIESATAKSWEQRHEMLDGRKSQSLDLGAKTQEMEIEIVTEKGEVDVTVEDTFGNTVFEIDDAKTGIYYFSAEGKIRITAEASEHKGSISVKRKES